MSGCSRAGAGCGPAYVDSGTPSDHEKEESVVSTIEAVAEAPGSNIEAGDVVAVDWNEEAKAMIEEFDQPHISCTLGWEFGIHSGTSTGK
jgi:hypothetical protein